MESAYNGAHNDPTRHLMPQRPLPEMDYNFLNCLPKGIHTTPPSTSEKIMVICHNLMVRPY